MCVFRLLCVRCSAFAFGRSDETYTLHDQCEITNTCLSHQHSNRYSRTNTNANILSTYGCTRSTQTDLVVVQIYEILHTNIKMSAFTLGWIEPRLGRQFPEPIKYENDDELIGNIDLVWIGFLQLFLLFLSEIDCMFFFSAI